MSARKTLFVGIDAGGTKTRLACCFSDEATTRYFEGPGINVKRDGIDPAISTCVQVIMDACGDDLVHSQLVLCAGMAGAGRREDRDRIASRLNEVLPIPGQNQIAILTDAEVAHYAAHREESGILIILGTGSIILAKTRSGRFVRAGGWGSVLGDEGGGYRLAQAGLAAVADAFDGGPPTRLKQKMEQVLGIDSSDALIEFVYDQDSAIQRLAPLVIEVAEAGDELALQIIDDQLLRLVNRLSRLLSRHTDIEKKACMIGGLSKNTFYRNHLIRITNARCPGLLFSTTQSEPADAALEIARMGKS